MPAAEENYLLLWSLLQQKMNDAGQLDGIDWSVIAERLKIDKVASAKMRWVRLREEFSKLGFPGLPDKSGEQGTNVKTAKTPKSPKKVKSTNPKARAAVEKKTSAKGKKGKADVKDEDDIEKETYHGEEINEETTE